MQAAVSQGRAGPDSDDRRDPELIRSILPFLNWLRTQYFRTEVEGEDLIPPDGRFIAVANHNGGPVLPDTWVMLSYWWSHFGPDRPAYALIHDAALDLPVIGDYLLRLGAVRASRRNAERVVARGATLLVYPGGELDCLKSFWERNRIDFHGRTGFIELAIRYGVPLLPVVNVGGHEVYFTVWSSRWLARWTGLARLTRVDTVPVNVGLPWGLWLGGFVPYLPLPAKFVYRVGEPIDLGHDPEIGSKPAALRKAYRKVTAVMQGMLDDLARRRRFPVLG